MSTLQENLNAIKLDKDTNLKPENLKAGITCLGVNGTYEGNVEDLQTELNAQDLVIQQLQDELVNKTQSPAKPNIFVQENEPSIKEGIWLQTKKPIDKIVVDKNIIESGNWDTLNTYTNIPYGFDEGSAVSIGTDVYLFGGSGVNTTAYKYDTLTDTYTQLANIPFTFAGGSTVVIDTNVYLFGSMYSSSGKKAYKYDISTDKYTKLTDIPYNFYHSSAVSIGTTVYLFGSYDGSYCKRVCKYDTLTNTYTQLTDIPYSFYRGSAVSIGTDVYLFGGSGGNTIAYKYDTLTNTYTQLTNIPFAFNGGSSVIIGTDVYLFGGYKNETTAYKYDILTDTYTQLTNIPYNLYHGSSGQINDSKIYLFGGNSNPTKVQVYVLNYKDYDNNSVVIWQGGSKYQTQLYTNENIEGRVLYPFYNAYHYTTEEGLDTTISTYYGNGIEWIKFKN